MTSVCLRLRSTRFSGCWRLVRVSLTLRRDTYFQLTLMDKIDSASFIDEYNALFDHSWSDNTPSDEVRFVVLDSETTGADARTAKLITIGAVVAISGEIDLADAY